MKNVISGFGASAAADGLRAFAAHYDNQPFVGRRQELQALDDWLGSEKETLLLVAPAGRGKSALLWQWVQNVPNVVWVPISLRFGTSRSQSVRRLLLSRLKHLGARGTGDWNDLARSNTPVIVVLDGLDESVDDGLADDLRDAAGEGVRIVVAARELVDRDADGWSTFLGWDDEVLEIEPLDRAAVSELVGEVDVHTLNEIVGLADGDPMTAILLADAAKAGASFSNWWEEETLDNQLLGVLSRAAAPVPPVLLAAVLKQNVEEVADALHAAGRFVVTNAQGSVTFAHPRLGYRFEDQMSDDERSTIDHSWAEVVETQLNELHQLDDGTLSYVLHAHRIHQTRVGATAAELNDWLTKDWLRAWERLEGGTTGFLQDVDAVWGAAEKEIDVAWSESIALIQTRMCAVRTALRSIERGITPASRAASVRLGCRGQRAAVESISAITDAWHRNQAIIALLPELDSHGFDLLLHALEPLRGQTLPVTELATRLLDLGMTDEARAWVLEDPKMRRATIVNLFERFDDLEPLRAAVREDLAVFDSENGVEWMVECTALSSVVFERDEQLAWLKKADDALTEFKDENLWWDSYYGERDPRLVLAEVYADAGETTRAREILTRVRKDPAPFADGDPKASRELVEAWVKVGDIPPDLLDDVFDRDASEWTLFRAGVGDREKTKDALTRVKPNVLSDVFDHGDREMCELAASLLVENVKAYAETPDDYGAGYVFYEGGSVALSKAGPYLSPTVRDDLLRDVWATMKTPRTPLSLWHTWSAILGLLASLDGDVRDEISKDVMNHALTLPFGTGSPPLCDFEAWWGAFDDGHREYVEYVLSQKRVGRPDDWVNALLDFESENATDVALALARAAGTDESLAWVSADPGRWVEVAEEAIEKFEASNFGVWALHHVIEHAPTPEQGEGIARRAWAARFKEITEMGCVGDILSALPEDEAEVIAERLLDEDRTNFVFPNQLPPLARARWIDERFDETAPLYERAEAAQQLNGVDDDARVRSIVNAVYDEAVATLDDGGLAALELIVGHLDVDQAKAIATDVFKSDSAYLKAQLAHRLKTLDAREFIQWDLSGEIPPMERLSVSLYAAETLEDLLLAFEAEPNARTYPWVMPIIVERGLAMEWATYLASFEDPSVRLIVWNHLWDDLSEHEQATLFPDVLRAMNDERATTRTSRYVWVQRLESAQLREQWVAELRHQRRSSSPAVPVAFRSVASGFGDVVAEVVTWFVS